MTQENHKSKIIVFLILLIWPVFLLMIGFSTGCNKPVNQPDHGWAFPVVVTSTKGGLIGGVDLYKWQNTIIALQGLDDATARYFLKGRSSNVWTEAHLTGLPNGYYWAYPAIDHTSDTVFFEQGYAENNQLVLKAILGQLKDQIALQNGAEKRWTLNKDEFFGTNNVRFTEQNEPGKRAWVKLGLGCINGLSLYIPFSVEGFTYNEKGIAMDRGPYVDGIFRSDNSGAAWQMERIADSDAFYPSICKTKDYYYYFAAGVMNVRNGWKLWFSRKDGNGYSWDTPTALTKTFAYGTIGHYTAVAGSDTIHVCWMDSWHNKWRFNPEGPRIENDDIYYCHRKDTDSGWGKNILLSKGLEYCYAPTMSIEGNNVVVAWSGIQSADKWHTDYGPNDIYYVTSNDNGNTWSRPLRVTDGAKDGITSGRPQVMLLNGVIHLFYIQGKRDLAELTPGLVKLNQPPWPIHYTQRPFPN